MSDDLFAEQKDYISLEEGEIVDSINVVPRSSSSISSHSDSHEIKNARMTETTIEQMLSLEKEQAAEITSKKIVKIETNKKKHQKKRKREDSHYVHKKNQRQHNEYYYRDINRVQKLFKTSCLFCFKAIIHPPNSVYIPSMHKSCTKKLLQYYKIDGRVSCLHPDCENDVQVTLSDNRVWIVPYCDTDHKELLSLYLTLRDMALIKLMHRFNTITYDYEKIKRENAELKKTIKIQNDDIRDLEDEVRYQKKRRKSDNKSKSSNVKEELIKILLEK